MNTCKNILSCRINGQSHLLPYGQGIADHLHAMTTNELGDTLWQMLSEGAGNDELLGYMRDAFEASDEDLPILRQDLESYLSELRNHGFLIPEERELPSYDPLTMEIGGLSINYYGPSALFETYFSAFSVAETAIPPDQEIFFFHHMPFHAVNGPVLIRNEEVLIMETASEYIILPQQSNYIFELHCTKDGKHSDVYCAYDAGASCLQELFLALRFAYLVLAENHELCVIHSASVLYQKKAWLFSGQSGTGKSTHVALWHDHLGAEYLNGDLNLVGIKNGQPLCYGLPWCGTSGLYTEKEYPLGGIVFLKQSPADMVSKPSGHEAILNLTQRMITPCWNASQLQHHLALAEDLCSRIFVFRLECTKNPSAAYVMKEAVDIALR